MILSTENIQHYTWGEDCDGWHLVKTDSLSVIQEKMPPGTSEKLHYHCHAQQLFYVLAGEATFVVEGRRHILRPHQALHVSKGAKHLIANQGEQALEFLVISEPASQANRHLEMT
ncbi:mannose-6-phosphate isomerase-like protein (cupin superfamily) [Pontibacter ummariensis]|uniref:Mannose-6-phosphate isomerase, cupin superfamily n=1 Tax=Pontibacter ummariensis TaxID=1610492 RepID=A0A239LKE8_9BACT|nr:cupin domain-containing protein [Pontibacter ummariensis]PRY03135.1 mannose-6-phosphate isomerase-like protein (cupin superfamily) [Pontibacter ummariensis]SNT30368.1 Mannose-6-phosphate isomerase, cupin superfamily [Pontibacter ummariensis]